MSFNSKNYDPEFNPPPPDPEAQLLIAVRRAIIAHDRILESGYVEHKMTLDEIQGRRNDMIRAVQRYEDMMEERETPATHPQGKPQCPNCAGFGKRLIPSHSPDHAGYKYVNCITCNPDGKS